MSVIAKIGQPGHLSHEQAGRVLADTSARVMSALSRGQALGQISAGLPRAQVEGLARAAGFSPACRRGCADCCVHAVGASPVEVLNLAGLVRATRSPAQLADLRRRLADRIAGGFGDGNGLPIYRSPCALLSPDRACSVHAHRPLACVGHHSLVAADCADPRGGHDFCAAQEQAAAYVSWGIGLGSEQAGLDGEAVELTRGLAVALDDPGIEARWRAGERVFEGARQAGAQRPAWKESVRRLLPVLRTPNLLRSGRDRSTMGRP